MGQRQDGKIVLSAGASGSGKTSIIHNIINQEKPKRLLVWDSDSQLSDLFGAEKIEEDIKQLGTRLIDEKSNFKTGFVSGNLKPDFAKFCTLAFHLGKMAPLTVIVEELADVTTPAKAPESWGVLLRRGRKYGISTYAVTQRIQEIDKTIVGNMAQFMVFQQILDTDKDKIKKMTGYDAPTNPMEFIHYDIHNQWTRKYGKIVYKNNRPVVGWKK